jgi:predicted CXXCH cytochrome family protein
MIIYRGTIIVFLGFFLLSMCGCDPTTRYKVLSTIFDGVPNPPPPEQVCAEYAEKRMAELRDELSGKTAEEQAKKLRRGSEHPPYAEKKCDDCHNKTTQSGFVTAKEDLCYVCHTGFIQGSYVHGPVAAKDCLFCHEPHNANFPSLLKKDPEALCATCHLEKRAASTMHDNVALKKMGCIDCHNPHFGKAPYFLK